MGMRRSSRIFLLPLTVIALLFVGCAPTAGGRTAGKLHVVATTTIVGNVVAQVGDDKIQLDVLIKAGAEPHSYAPAPADMAKVYDAAVVFAAGAGLESFMDRLTGDVGGRAVRVDLSQGLQLQHAIPLPGESDRPAEYNPHVWFSVPNVIHWVGQIREALIQADPANRAVYEANAAEYVKVLEELDRWIFDQVAGVPAEHRKLVASHSVFGYFTERYGFEQVGAVYPAGPSAEPSAQDISALEDMIRKLNVPAVFTESTVNPRLAEQVARDTATRILPLYTDSLGGPDSPAASYVEMMRYDVRTIVEGLSGSPGAGR